jgi:hypothetical protein
MNRKTFNTIGLAFSIFIFMCSNISTSKAAPGTGCSEDQLVETTMPMNKEFHHAVSEVLCERTDLHHGNPASLIITSSDLKTDQWAILTVVKRPDSIPANFESLLQFDAKMVIGLQQAQKWQFAVEGDPIFSSLVQQAPDEVLPPVVRESLINPKSKSIHGIPIGWGLKWPWRMGQGWYYTQGPHNWNGTTNPNGSSLDFSPGYDIAAQDREVTAAVNGWVKLRCVDYTQTDVVLDSWGYTTGYLHLSYPTTTHLHNGDLIGQGGRLGILYNGAPNSGCGHGTRPHLHFYIGTYNSTTYPEISIVGTVVSGWTLQSGGSFSKPGFPNYTVSKKIYSDNESPQTIQFGQTISSEINPAGEIDVFFFNGTQSQIVSLSMEKTSGSLDPYIAIYKPNGTSFVYLDYNDDADWYTLDSRKSFTLPVSGKYMVWVWSYSDDQTGGYRFSITSPTATSTDTDDNRWISHAAPLTGFIYPKNDNDNYYFYGYQGYSINLHLDAQAGSSLDTYLELYSPSGTFLGSDDDSGDGTNSWLQIVLPVTGIYRVRAISYNYASQGAYYIDFRYLAGSNLALRKPVTCSSVQNSNLVCSKAVDGNTSTRWGSVLYKDPQYIYVDLGQYFWVDTVLLRWEAAYAKSYSIQYYNDSSWVSVFSTTGGRGGNEIVKFDRVRTRYLLIYGTQRANSLYGYSLWEMEVYSTRYVTTNEPENPQPNKEPSTIERIPPPPPVEEANGKDVLLNRINSGDFGQFLSPPLADPPSQQFDLQPSFPGTPQADIEFVTPGYPGSGVKVSQNEVLYFKGLASDDDFEGEPDIIAYEWQLDNQEILSRDLEFSIQTDSLTAGSHIVTFRAQDNEGNWSQTASINIQVYSNLYLPLIRE